MVSPRLPRAFAAILAAAAVAAAGAQASSAASPAPKRALVTWNVGGERFRSYVNVPADIARVRDAIRAGTAAGIPIGRIARGTRENTGHRWHLRNVRLADLTIEVCDGRPSHLDRDLDYWIGTVERYCPWGAVPVRLRWVVPRGLLTRDTTYALSVIDARPRGG